LCIIAIDGHGVAHSLGVRERSLEFVIAGSAGPRRPSRRRKRQHLELALGATERPPAGTAGADIRAVAGLDKCCVIPIEIRRCRCGEPAAGCLDRALEPAMRLAGSAVVAASNCLTALSALHGSSSQGSSSNHGRAR
jgi:hypothetical protein